MLNPQRWLRSSSWAIPDPKCIRQADTVTDHWRERIQHAPVGTPDLGDLRRRMQLQVASGGMQNHTLVEILEAL
jgi:hypothetical protein